MSGDSTAPEPQPATISEDAVLEALREVYDPEIPVNIVDLGLIYEITLTPGRAKVRMTLTAIGCPMAPEVIASVRDRLVQLEGIEETEVELVYDPPWSPDRMSEEARWELGMV
jgi:FeS assembly SUF system protein